MPTTPFAARCRTAAPTPSAPRTRTRAQQCRPPPEPRDTPPIRVGYMPIAPAPTRWQTREDAAHVLRAHRPPPRCRPPQSPASPHSARRPRNIDETIVAMLLTPQVRAQARPPRTPMPTRRLQRARTQNYRRPGLTAQWPLPALCRACAYTVGVRPRRRLWGNAELRCQHRRHCAPVAGAIRTSAARAPQCPRSGGWTYAH